MTIFLWCVVALLAAVWLGVVFIGPPFVPTLKRDIEAVFTALNIGKRDVLVDLGAGDGRVLQRAAERGARVSGVEINPILVAISRWRLRNYRGSVVLGDMWQYHLPDDVTHVFVFPAEVFMNKLEKYLTAQREHTTPFWMICYGFRFKGREPKKVIGAFNLYQF